MANERGTNLGLIYPTALQLSRLLSGCNCRRHWCVDFAILVSRGFLGFYGLGFSSSGVLCFFCLRILDCGWILLGQCQYADPASSAERQLLIAIRPHNMRDSRCFSLIILVLSFYLIGLGALGTPSNPNIL